MALDEEGKEIARVWRTPGAFRFTIEGRAIQSLTFTDDVRVALREAEGTMLDCGYNFKRA